MMTLMTAALVAAQPAPAPAQQGQMAPMAPQQQMMKKDCCKDGCKECCKDMAGKHESHSGEHGGHAAK